jgi:hypothetical protein
MKKEIDNTSKPVLQTDEQACKDNQSKSTDQSKARSMQRRRLLKGLGAAPMVMTLHSGAAMAAKSNDITSCRGTRGGDTPKVCVEEGHKDNYVRVKLGPNGKIDNVRHKAYEPSKPNEDVCLINVNANGDPLPIDEFNPDLVVTGSCWASF